MITTRNATDGSGVVVLEGRVDIAEAGKLKSALLEALAAPGDMRVEVGGASSVDVTVAQLLWAAQRQARQAGKRFEVAGPWREEAAGQLQELGIYPAQLFGSETGERQASRGVE